MNKGLIVEIIILIVGGIYLVMKSLNSSENMISAENETLFVKILHKF